MSLAGFPFNASAIDTLSNDFPFQIKVLANSDGTLYKVVRAYNGTGSALTAGRPYLLRYDGDEETNPTVIVPATATAVVNYVVFATEAVPAASFGWFVINGWYSVLTNGSGSAIAKDDALEVLNSGVALVLDASYGANTCAIAGAASTGAADSTRVFVLGERVSVQAS